MKEVKIEELLQGDHFRVKPDGRVLEFRFFSEGYYVAYSKVDRITLWLTFTPGQVVYKEESL